MTTFKSLGLSDRLLARLSELGLTAPTPIQAQAIPHVLDGRDVMGLAQTGTGKTAAFGLPLVQHLSRERGKPAPKTARALVLAPTRELAKQIEATLKSLTQGTPTRTTVVVGGASLNVQAERLSRGTDILVATPGRLMDLLERDAVDITGTRFLVLDEADQMLDMGFIHALRRIVRYLPRQRQTLLFSATMPKLMAEVAASYLNDPIRVEVTPPGKAADKIDQAVHFVTQGDKAKLLESYLDKHRDELALVFGRTKHGAEKLMKLLASWGFAAASIHGNKSQGQRDRALAAFKSGEIRVLVATDVAARGLDIPAVRHVYNYDLPNVPENYVHRIGRTARAGADGKAIAFCAPAEMDELRAIEKVMKIQVPVIGGEPWTPAPLATPAAKGKPGAKGKADAKSRPRRRRPKRKAEVKQAA
ncbi:DEAD/DEAH box helicase [Ostreiculturibacter nitratireducens]|uniref:DEAD/DEAH box helicase n=1 Tax=Ostreiculturibacter nitratireducens TaxID=3075226 RepID=UPI0031B5E4C4